MAFSNYYQHQDESLVELVAMFKKDVLKSMKDPENKRPLKNTKVIEILVRENKDASAEIILNYYQEFFRMFGKGDTVNYMINEKNMKNACEIARSLKALTNLPIRFIPYNPDHDLEMI